MISSPVSSRSHSRQHAQVFLFEICAKNLNLLRLLAGRLPSHTQSSRGLGDWLWARGLGADWGLSLRRRLTRAPLLRLTRPGRAPAAAAAEGVLILLPHLIGKFHKSAAVLHRVSLILRVIFSFRNRAVNNHLIHRKQFRLTRNPFRLFLHEFQLVFGMLSDQLLHVLLQQLDSAQFRLDVVLRFVQFVLAVKAFPLFNDVVSLWIFLGVLEANSV